MSPSDQNSNMPFLRNEYFENPFTMTLLTKITHSYDPMKNCKFKLKN